MNIMYNVFYVDLVYCYAYIGIILVLLYVSLGYVRILSLFHAMYYYTRINQYLLNTLM